jgi:hypothetical protein
VQRRKHCEESTSIDLGTKSDSTLEQKAKARGAIRCSWKSGVNRAVDLISETVDGIVTE